MSYSDFGTRNYMDGLGYSGPVNRGSYGSSSYTCSDVGLFSCSGGVFTGKESPYAVHY